MYDNFENIKLSLHNAEQLDDVKKNPVVKATILSFVKAIPILGELIDSSIDVVLTDFQQKKRDELLDIILDNSEYIMPDMVNDVEFIMNFAKIIDAVNRLASNDKVAYLAYLLKNSYLCNNKIDEDYFEEYLNIINNLSYKEMRILIEVYRYEKEKMGNLEWDEMCNTVKSNLNLEIDEIEAILQKLSANGLAYPEPSGLFTADTKIKVGTTQYFKKFADRVLNSYL